MSNVGLLKELWSFMRAKKKFWLLPAILLLFLLGTLMILSEGSVLAPFIYTIF